MAPKARHAKGKARLNAYEKLADEESKKEARSNYISAGALTGDRH